LASLWVAGAQQPGQGLEPEQQPGQGLEPEQQPGQGLEPEQQPGQGLEQQQEQVESREDDFPLFCTVRPHRFAQCWYRLYGLLSAACESLCSLGCSSS
jgi:hypothetical protein